MRSLILILILLNGLLLAWQQGWIGQQKAAATVLIRAPFVQAPQKLLLLDELPEDQRALMSMITNTQTRRDEAQQQLDEAQQEVAGVQSQLSGLQGTALAPAETVGQPGEESGEESGEEPGEEPVIEGLPGEEIGLWCGTAGAFASEGAAEDFIDGLAALGVDGQLETRQEAVSSTYWVHMPPFASPSAARAMLEELQQNNIDSYILPDGDLAGGISVGVFTRQERALVAQEQFARRGYPTSIAKIDRLGPRHYASIEMPDRNLLDSAQWLDFLGDFGNPPVAEKLCEVIAPDIQFQ